MAKRKGRDFHYYDWEFPRWLGSQTRANCVALGGLIGLAARGAYRELLDFCYKEGHIPADIDELAALCVCTPDVMAEVWPVIKGKFRLHPKLPGRLINDQVNVRRRAFENKIRAAKRGGVASAKKREELKAPENSNLVKSGTGSLNQIEASSEQVVNSKEKRASEQNGASPHHAETELEIVRRSLASFLGQAPPDDALVKRVIAAAHGHSAQEINAYLCELYEKRKPGTRHGPKTYGWFVPLVKSHFTGGHA